MIVNRNVEVLPPGAAMAPDSASDDAFTDAVDLAELFDIEMKKTGLGPFIPHHGRRRSFEQRQTVQADRAKRLGYQSDRYFESDRDLPIRQTLPARGDDCVDRRLRCFVGKTMRT